MTIQPMGSPVHIDPASGRPYAVDPYGRSYWLDAPVLAYAPGPSGPRKAVTKSPRHTSHGLHLVLTVLTLGLWAPVWLLVTMLNSVSREKSVTRYR